MALFFLSLFGGALTIFSPCVLPLLPIIIGGSLTQQHRWRPLVITGSLATSVVIFTLLLKWSTALVHVPQMTWSIISGVLVVALGLVMIFPQWWDRITTRLKLSQRSDAALQQSGKRTGLVGAVLTGLALGPVFSSCSPTYALILATVLPQSFRVGLENLIAYAIGLSAVLLLIAIFGQAFIKRTRWLANPNGTFRRILGVVFVIVGVLIAFGIDKQVENSLIARGLGVTQIEQRLVETIHTGLVGNDLLDIDTSNAGSNTGAEMNVRTPIQAPELQGIASWINGDPLRLAELKGKVVLIDFWTYSCINCIRTLPHLEAWYKAYAADGLVIIGVHSPEFSFEHELANVQNFVSENDITYPVALDNTFTTWRAYNNRYWPASYFIDREGKIRHTHFGEGDYEENEKVIRALLAEGGNAVNGAMTDIPEETSYVQSQTPETYLGYERATRFANSSEAVDDTDHTYTLHDSLQQNEWSIGGTWNMSGEKLTAVSDAVLRLRFTAKNVYLVMGSHDIATLDVTVDGVTQDTVTIQDATLYPVVSGDTVRSGSLLELHIPAGAELNAFTFGS